MFYITLEKLTLRSKQYYFSKDFIPYISVFFPKEAGK